MRSPRGWYRVEEVVAERLPGLTAAQRRGLALWVYGAVLAQSGCQSAVVGALALHGRWDALRQRLREWLYDGCDKAAPCRAQVTVALCFAPLLRWVVGWWRGTELALAVDATAHGDRVVALVVSVLYRGGALPVAWAILPANREGAWMSALLRLLRLLRPAVPPSWTVLVLADRGLWSPRLWKRLRDLGWHPLLRVRDATTFQPVGRRRQPARGLVPGPGHAWVGRGVAFRHRPVRRAGTLVVVWAAGHDAPWVLLTDLPPERVGLCWYGLRAWVELGFRALKGVGWQWQRTQRTAPDRVARHWLVLAVATLWVTAVGTRAEDAARCACPASRLLRPPPGPAPPRRRRVSVFRRGLPIAHAQLLDGRPWLRLWLAPEPWPHPPPDLTIARHPG